MTNHRHWVLLIRKGLLPFLCFVLSVAHADNPHKIINNVLLAGELTPQFDTLIDESGNLTINEVLNYPDAGWKKNSSTIPSYGFSNSTYWVRFEVETKSPDLTNWYLEVGYALLDKITLYQIEEGVVSAELETGDASPFSERLVEHRELIFPISVRPNQPTHIYLKIKSTSAIQIPLTLWQPAAFYAKDQYNIMAHGVYYGLIFVMVLYNFFLFIRFRDRVYLLYVLYVSTFSLAQMALNGFAYQLLWPNADNWNQFCLAVLAPTIVAIGTVFVNHALKLKSNFISFYWYFNTLSGVATVLAIAGLIFPYSMMIKLSAAWVIVACSSALYVSYYAWLKGGHKFAAYFSFAWSVFLFGVVCIALNKFGIIPRNFVTESSAQIGSALEVILLSYALAERLYEAKRKRFQAESLARSATESMLKTQEDKLRLLDINNTHLESEVEERTKLLNEAKIVAEEATKQKARFLAAASHDIRQPLQAISLLAETLPTEPTSTANAPQAANDGSTVLKLRKAIENLTSLCNQLFDLSKIDNHQIKPDFELVNPKLLVQDIYEQLNPLCQNQGILLNISMPPDTKTIYSDPVILQRILSILVDNAIKHAICRHIQIAIEIKENQCEFLVADDGIGIPEQDQTKVFEEFYQTKNPERNQYKGMGLGLSLCHRLVSLLGSELTLVSESGKGCEFSFHQNIAERTLTVETSQSDAQDESTFANLNILILDDDVGACDAMFQLLKQWGLHCRFALTIDDAYLTLEDGWIPDIAIIDYRLPDKKTGLEFAQEMKDKFGPCLSVLIMTGDVYLSAPDVDFPILFKPLKPSMLRAALHRCCLEREAASALT